MQILKDNNLDFSIIEYLKKPPKATELKEISKKLNLKPSQFIRKSEKIYKELNVIDIINDENELLLIISKNPILLERPIIINQDKAVIGRPPENILTLIK